MSLLKAIPKIYYSDIEIGKDFFIEGLGFECAYQDPAGELLTILYRGNVTIHICQNSAIANEHRPELRIETADIESLYKEVEDRRPDLFHPNLNKVKAQPWGLKEFALLDKSGVCVIIQQSLG